jgi:hypothetical protein
VASGIRSLRPAAAALRLGNSCLCPIELGQLLRAMAALHRPLVCFRPALEAVGSASAGILRAARQRQAAVALLVELGASPSRSFPSTLTAVAAAAEDAGYDLPLALLAQGSLVRSDAPAELATAFVGEILEAGFPTPVLDIDADGFGAELLEPAGAVARERGLGWALSFAEDRGTELSPFLARLAELGCAPAAVRWGTLSPRTWPRALQGAAPWVGSSGRELPEQREEAVAAGLGLVDAPGEDFAGARAERAEALAYFAADAALSAWDVEQTGPRAAAALLDHWKD